MSRKTVMHVGMTSDYSSVSQSNRSKVSGFLRYLKGMRRCQVTVNQYRSWLEVYFCWNRKYNGDKPFAKLRKGDFMRYFSWVMSFGVGSSRLHGLRSSLSSMSDWFENAYGDGFPRFRNCVKTIPMPKNEHVRKPTVLSDSDVSAMIERCHEAGEPQLAAYIALLASCGCRKGEALQFKMSFFSDGNACFNDTMWKTPEIRLKGGKMRSKYVLKSRFSDELSMYWSYRKEKHIRTDSFFVKKNGKPATQATLSLFATRISRICGMDFYAHCMRHYFATSLIRKGIQSQTIVRIVGWESADMLSIYDDRSDDEAIEESLKGITI